MKREAFDGSRDREILVAMLAHPTVAGRLAAKWGDGNRFLSSYANVVGAWCAKHWSDYQLPLRAGVRSYFEEWAAHQRSEEAVEVVSDFLASLSQDYDRTADDLNPERLLDMADEHWNWVAVRNLKEELEADLQARRTDKAIDRIRAYSKIEIGAEAGADAHTDEDVVKSAFEDRPKPLVEFDGAFQQFLGNTMRRNSLVAFIAPEKYGKSFMLNELAYRFAAKRIKVGYFVVGDLTRGEALLRFYSRLSERPLISTDGDRWPCDVKFPVSIEPPVGDDGIAIVGSETRTFKRPLGARVAWKKCQEFNTYTVKDVESYFRLSAHATNSVKVADIKSIVDSWAPTFQPSVVVIDYADNLDARDKRADKRDQINEVWKSLKEFAQTSHVLVLTATQVNREGYGVRTLTRKHISNDKRKLAEVDAMIGINMLPMEQAHGVQRLNYLANRWMNTSEYRCLCVAGCWALSRSVVQSCWETQRVA